MAGVDTRGCVDDGWVRGRGKGAGGLRGVRVGLGGVGLRCGAGAEGAGEGGAGGGKLDGHGAGFWPQGKTLC